MFLLMLCRTCSRGSVVRAMQREIASSDSEVACPPQACFPAAAAPAESDECDAVCANRQMKEVRDEISKLGDNLQQSERAFEADNSDWKKG